MIKIEIPLLAARGMSLVHANGRAPYQVPRLISGKQLWQISSSRAPRFSSAPRAKKNHAGMRELSTVRANGRVPYQVPRLISGKRPWQISSSQDSRFYSALRALGIVAVTSESSLHCRAKCSEGDTIADDTTVSVAENDESNFDTTRGTDTKRTSVGEMGEFLSHISASWNGPLMYGLLGSNVAMYSAFTLGFFLSTPPRPRPTLLRFLSRNFILSPGWLSRGRWHVMLTCMFAHLTLGHLIKNMWGIFTGVWLCSDFLDAWQIAGLYFGGGLVGASASIALTKILRKPRFVRFVTGASDGVYALYYYWLCAENWEDLKPLSVPLEPLSIPLEPIAKGIFLYIFVTECIGLRKYIRYGYAGKGHNAVQGNHAAHLGGAATGLMAYGLPRVSENVRRNKGIIREDKRIEGGGSAETVKKPTVATGRVGE